MWRLILKQFDDLLVKILLGAAVVDFLLAASSGESFGAALVEPSVIVLILVANGGWGFFVFFSFLLVVRCSLSAV